MFDILQSVKMWTLWPTAPWCSGSSSAADLTSDKCAARRARDTEETMKLTNIVHVPLSHTTRQPSLYLCQRGALLDWLGHYSHHWSGETISGPEAFWVQLGQISLCGVFIFHWRQGCWNLERQSGGETSVLRPPSLSLSVSLSHPHPHTHSFPHRFGATYIALWPQDWSRYEFVAPSF